MVFRTIKPKFEPTLLVRPHPFRTEGPKGYLLRLAEVNWTPNAELQHLGVLYEPQVLLAQGLLPDAAVDDDLHLTVTRVAEVLKQSPRVWNHKYSRFCPLCLAEDAFWRIGWELLFHDACPEHGVWLIDQCASCGEKVAWNRDYLVRCQCGSDLRAEQASACPDNVARLSSILLEKLRNQQISEFPEPFEKLDIEQTQRLIRFVGSYMHPEAGRNPLKIQQAGTVTASWRITSLAAEILFNWPAAFYQSLEMIQNTNDDTESRRLGSVFGRAYHYLYRGLEGAAFNPVRRAFEEWLGYSWRGGLAKRNRRLGLLLLDKAVWIPEKLARETLGASHQRLSHLIREGVIEGETHVSLAGRKFDMVRRDQLDLARAAIDGSIDMKTAGALLGLTKGRTRQILQLLFPDARKTGVAASTPWSVPRASVENLLEIQNELTKVSIPDEGCVSIGHILRYWAWPAADIADLIQAARKGELEIISLIDGSTGLSSWVFQESLLKVWKAKSMQGYGTWLTVNQMAKLINIKQQAAYDLVRMHFINGEKLHKQPRGGVRVSRIEIERFKQKYVFCTEISQLLGVSPRKAKSMLADVYIQPVSGPGIDDARQILYLRNDALESALQSISSKEDHELSLI